MKPLVFSIVFLLFSHSSLATNVEYQGEVKGFYIDKNGLVLVNISNPDVPVQCNSQPWPFAFNITDTSASANQWLSMLTVSRTTKTPIKMGYVPSETGRCSINYFYYLD